MNIRNFALIVPAALAAAGLAAAAATETNSVSAANVIVGPTNTASATTATAGTSNSVLTLVLPSNAPGTNAPAASTNALAVAEPSDAVEIVPTNAVRMNFHDAPLNTIVNYLSAKMGFSVVSDGELHGTATIVSEQPVGTNEVIRLLSTALAKNNYAVSTNGRVLTIASMDSATTGATTPVNHPDSPKDIPMNDEVATDVLAVHTLNPTQLTKDLAELVPAGAKLAANESGNALIMTARQKDIHRFAEIIAALDSSSVAQVEVFVLKFADAKAVASELKEVFQSPDSTVARSDARMRFRGGGGFGGMFGGGGGGDNSSSADAKNAANKAVFVSDDQMNAVVASAPPDYFLMITNVIESLDQPSQDITEMRVFPLKYADAQETADLLSNLFPDETKSSDQNTRSMGFRFTPPWMQQAQAPSGNKSDRMTRQATVRAVPDLRTASVVVTTSSNLMVQIAGVISNLDNNPAMVKHVYSYDIDNADPTTVQSTMTALFAGQNTRAPQNTTTSALAQRQQNNAQTQTQSTTGFGGSGGGTTALH
jgi:type II secretory pathway component GspD/PulD (secretin)